MKNKLQELIEAQTQVKYATETGRIVHAQMKHIFFGPGGWVGDESIVSHLKNNPELCELFGAYSRTEVPIAGTVCGRFISRRIDRLYVNNNTKTIIVLDYKTDKDKNLFHEKYVEQLNEYRALLNQIYRHFDIQCKILWLNDFTLENVPTKDIIPSC
jgi:ATP-dependent exoDNAse (exonuclease V) beta subunit